VVIKTSFFDKTNDFLIVNTSGKSCKQDWNSYVFILGRDWEAKGRPTMCASHEWTSQCFAV